MAKDKTPDTAVAPVADTIESLQAKNAALEKQLADLTAAKAVNEADEKIIAEKMVKGLSRAQAIAVIKRNREFAATPLAKERAEKYNKLVAQSARS